MLHWCTLFLSGYRSHIQVIRCYVKFLSCPLRACPHNGISLWWMTTMITQSFINIGPHYAAKKSGTLRSSVCWPRCDWSSINMVVRLSIITGKYMGAWRFYYQGSWGIKCYDFVSGIWNMNWFNSLAPERCGSDFKSIIFKLNSSLKLLWDEYH